MAKRVVLWLAVVLSSVIAAMPAREATAFFPVPGLLIYGATTGGAVALPTASGLGAAASWVGLGALLGVAGAAAVDHLIVRDKDGKELRVPVKSAVPPPPAAPTTSPQLFWETDTGAFRSTTTSAVCNAVTEQAFNNIYSGSPTFWTSYTATVLTPPSGDCGATTCCKMQGSTGSVFFPLQQVSACPAGYSGPSGGVCTLTNARLATPDGKRDFGVSGDTFSPITADADANGLDYYADGNKIRVSGMDEYGNRATFEIERTDGHTKITSITQTADMAGNSTVTTKTAQLNTDGKVTQTTQATQAGSLSLHEETHAATVQPPPEGSQEPGQQPCIPGGAGAQACEQTAQEIKNALTLKSEADKPADPTSRTKDDIKGVMPSLGLTGWTIPAHTATCPTMTFNVEFLGWDGVSVAEHCNLMDATRETAAVWLDLVWLLVALLVILTA